MDISQGVGEILETGKTTTQKTIRDTGSTLNSTILGQVGVPVNPNAILQNKVQNGQGADYSQPQIDPTERTREFVDEIYGVDDVSQAQPPQAPDDAEVQQQLARDRAELQKLFKNQHDEEYFIPLQQQSVPHDSPQQPDGQTPGPQIAEAKPMSELGTLGSVETTPGRGANKPFALAARRAMTNTELRGSSPG